MPLIVQLLLFCLGLAFGSFLNVITLRYSPDSGFYHKEHFTGRSHCPHCHKILSWYELIPLASYMIQLGRCRVCQKRLTVQYPIVELTSGLMFLYIPLVIKNLFTFTGPNYAWYWGAASFIWIVAFLFLLAAFIIDIRHYVIPNSVNITLLAVSIIWIGIGIYMGAFSDIYKASFLKQFSVIFPSFQSMIVNHIFGAVVALLFFLAIFIFSRGRAMGMGDVKLMGVLGLLFGWPDIIPIMFLSFIIGAAVSVLLIASGKKKMTDKVPFGPFIVIATAIIFFFGAGLLSAYFGIIGL